MADLTEGVLAKVGLGIVVFLTLMVASPDLSSLVAIGVFLSVFVNGNLHRDGETANVGE